MKQQIESTGEWLPFNQQQKYNEKRSVFNSYYPCESQQATLPSEKIHVRALQNLQSLFQEETVTKEQAGVCF